MNEILTDSFVPLRWQFWPPQSICVVVWNIDRGLRLPDILDFMASQDADLLVLQEVDLHARRTHRVNVAEELARKLGMNYVFGREFQELTQGSQQSPAYHGQATLSRWPLQNPRVIRFERQSGFWRPRWFLPNTAPFQERLGGRMALATEVDLMGRVLTVYNLHLESRGDDKLRICQLRQVLNDAANTSPSAPALVAGDLNLDISAPQRGNLIQNAGFRNVMDQPRLYTTPPHGVFGSPRAIDWALISGPVEAGNAQVHSTVKASDHYPISFTLRFI
jgi:endonuclease/exonuclease/phosphatase family metal-dependent hydrolase